MSFLGEHEQAAVKEMFNGPVNPVKLVHFTQELLCGSCPETQRLLEEVVSLSDRLALEIHNFAIEKEVAAQYKIDKVPATVVEGGKDFGIRLYGLP